MEIKSDGLKAIVTILFNVSEFMSSLGNLLESGDFNNLDPSTQKEIIENTKSISKFLSETSLSLNDMIVQKEGSEDDVK